MQNLEKAFQCLRQILLERNIEVRSKASVLSESGFYIRKLEQQIQWISYQNYWISNRMESHKRGLPDDCEGRSGIKCEQRLTKKPKSSESFSEDEQDVDVDVDGPVELVVAKKMNKTV